MILVTGSSGNVGREVARVLGERGVPLARTRVDFKAPSTFRSAVEGCRAVFLMRPPAISDVEHTLNPFVDVARSAGVEQIVFLSVAGAQTNKIVPHHAVEQHLMKGPASWTILRPGFFAQNLGDAYRKDIVEHDRLYVPAGSGRAAFVDVRDVAEIAADALTSPKAHAGAGHTLTGPEAVSFSEAAAMLSEVLGRRIEYVPASVAGYAFHLRARRKLPLAQVAVQTILHVGLRFGQAERVDPTLQELLGPERKAHTLRSYIEDHASLFR